MNVEKQVVQAVDLNQIGQLRAQQKIGKLQNLMNIALQIFLNGRAKNIPEAFMLAEQFLAHFEKNYVEEGIK